MRVDALHALEAAYATEDLAAIDAALLHCAEVGLPDDADGTKTAAARREEVVLKLAEEKRVAAVAALEAAPDVEAIDAALLACTEAGVAEDHEAVAAATEKRAALVEAEVGRLRAESSRRADEADAAQVGHGAASGAAPPH